MEKEKVTPIRWHLYHFYDKRQRAGNTSITPQSLTADPWQYILIFLIADMRGPTAKEHFAIVASNKEIVNDTLDIYKSFTNYNLKEISVKDLPLFINWYQTSLFARLLKEGVEAICPPHGIWESHGYVSVWR